MINEIVKAVAKKAKIPEVVAQIAVDTAISTLKKKLPPAIGSALDALLDSQGGIASKAKSSKSKKDDNLLGDLGSIAGKLLNKK